MKQEQSIESLKGSISKKRITLWVVFGILASITLVLLFACTIFVSETSNAVLNYILLVLTAIVGTSALICLTFAIEYIFVNMYEYKTQYHVYHIYIGFAKCILFVGEEAKEECYLRYRWIFSELRYDDGQNEIIRVRCTNFLKRFDVFINGTHVELNR